jgi:hypothetical protein
MALTAIASHAKAAGRYISYRTDTTGELAELYVW